MAWLSVSSVVRVGKMGLLIILVALGFADRNGHGQSEAVKELFEIDGVLTGGIDAHVEVRIMVLFM